ncbi:MAG: DUF4212 domain-containing protein, partial [Pseudomonadales bacterium]
MSEAPRDTEDRNRAYWRANLMLMLMLLAVWFSVSFLAGIVFVDWLDQFTFFGFKLGFWFSQQGSIFSFVALIFIYAWRIQVIERQFGLDDPEDKITNNGA